MQGGNNIIEPKDADALRSARKDIIAGALWCLGGLAVTYLTYYFAKPGASYTVAYGAVIYGGYQGLRGLWTYLTEVKSDRKRFGKGLALGILGILAVVGLGIGGWKFSHKDDIRLLGVEQTLDDDAVGLHVTIPAGYTKVETFVREETDSTYAMMDWTAESDTRVFHATAIEGSYPDSLAALGSKAMEDWLMESMDGEGTNFEGKLLLEAQMVELGGVRWLKFAGVSNYLSNCVNICYHTIHRNSQIFFDLYYHFEGDAPDALDELENQRADAFISRVRLDDNSIK